MNSPYLRRISKVNMNSMASGRALGNLTQIFKFIHVAGRRTSTPPPATGALKAPRLGSFHLAAPGPFLLHGLQFPAPESAVFKRKRSDVSAISGHSHLVKMIWAGLGLLPEPGKHEISPVQISQAEICLSLSFSLSQTHTLFHQVQPSEFITQVRFTEVYIKIPSLRVICMSERLPTV